MKVDPYLNEPTADLDPETHRLFLEAKENAKSWQAEADRLQAELESEMGDAHAGLVNGYKLVTHRPINTYRISALVKDYPELTQHYVTRRVVEELDVTAFAQQHEDILGKYRSRSFRTIADV